MTVPIEHGIAAALRSNGKSEFYKSLINLSYRHSGRSVTENSNYDGTCTTHGSELYSMELDKFVWPYFRNEPQTCSHLNPSNLSSVST